MQTPYDSVLCEGCCICDYRGAARAGAGGTISISKFDVDGDGKLDRAHAMPPHPIRLQLEGSLCQIGEAISLHTVGSLTIPITFI